MGILYTEARAKHKETGSFTAYQQGLRKASIAPHQQCMVSDGGHIAGVPFRCHLEGEVNQLRSGGL